MPLFCLSLFLYVRFCLTEDLPFLLMVKVIYINSINMQSFLTVPLKLLHGSLWDANPSLRTSALNEGIALISTFISLFYFCKQF